MHVYICIYEYICTYIYIYIYIYVQDAAVAAIMDGADVAAAVCHGPEA